MRKILVSSLFTVLLLTACAAQVTTKENPAFTGPTEFVLDLRPLETYLTKPEMRKEPTVKIASVEEEQESSTFVSLKAYMELHGLPSDVAAEYAGYIEKYATEYEVDPYLVLAIIHVETGSTYINKTKPNSHGAVGLMQILERNVACNNSPGGCQQKVWEGFTKDDLKNPERNIELGVRYLKYLQDRFGYELGITAYNQGEGNVARKTYRNWYKNKVLYALKCIQEGKENHY